MSVAIMVKKKTTVACFLAISVAMIVIISIRSFSTWLENVTATLAATIGVLVAVGVYIYFPEHLCRRCWSPVFQLARRQRQETTRLVPHSHGLANLLTRRISQFPIQQSLQLNLIPQRWIVFETVLCLLSV